MNRAQAYAFATEFSDLPAKKGQATAKRRAATELRKLVKEVDTQFFLVVHSGMTEFKPALKAAEAALVAKATEFRDLVEI